LLESELRIYAGGGLSAGEKRVETLDRKGTVGALKIRGGGWLAVVARIVGGGLAMRPRLLRGDAVVRKRFAPAEREARRRGVWRAAGGLLF
jgi:hypothetical protein